MSRPDEALQDPSAEDPMPFLGPFVLGGNFASPAYYIAEIAKSLAGFDPFGWAAQHMEGDWEAVEKAGGAAGNLGRFNAAYAEALRTDWQNTVEQSWQGKAATAAETYFNQLARSVDFQVRSLEEIERKLSNTATLMRERARLVADLLQDVADEIIFLAASWAAEAILASSLVGAPAAAAQAAVSAACIARIIIKIDQVVNWVTVTFKVVYGVIGELYGLSNQTAPDKLPPLPNAAYDNLGV
ncbi:uncharacterized protein YukE [Nocardia transvalensis]|uniref:Uncharacterized protein YukE n=1 Tax=Nocardia transvalensis TaxID=37333 RepID=A0A7W9PI76_9NOCA|nr:WXG100 family type VII secretion target [Nocardia transvalensis]MBB5916360.1 uncharacterized protein YukE [Nocardia transvalensis]